MNNDIEENKIEKRLLMPTVGNVSVGKSCFLNALFGINCLQVQSDITTKFILFIRHIDGLKEPELFNVIPIKNKDSYDFYKNGDVIKGEKNIIIKINEINSKVSNNCFFMLKIEIKSIKNKEFLNKFDFLDIPGLNESKIDYIDIYFEYIKDMIKYCLIIFSTENYNSKDTIEVIKKIAQNIKVPLENFLLILNKIDLVNDKVNETIHNFEKILLNSDVINCFDNKIIPVNTLKLKSEIQIENNFSHYINYYFNEYKKENNQSQFSFLIYIKKIISELENEKKNLLKEKINTLNEEEIKNIKVIVGAFINEKICSDNLIIDLDNKNDLQILKLFYLCFLNKLLFPENSETYKEIISYFNDITDYSLPKKIDININENIFDDEREINKILKDLDNFFENSFNSSKLKKYGNIVPLINDDFKILKNYILNASLLYIPILGISNSGKSSFINSLLQKNILTHNSEECTKRGIIIRYIKNKKEAYLYSIKFVEKEILGEKYYYYKKYKLLSNKIDIIKKIIDIKNESDPNKKEDSFLLLEINIKMLDELNINQEFKNNICFIDFPGHNTNNNFFLQNELFQNVIKMSSSFIYINSGKAFKNESNKLLLSKLYKEVIEIRKGDISPSQYIDSCLFIFNKVDLIDKDEKNLNGIQNQIKEILSLPDNFETNISCSFFSSLFYDKFIEKKSEYKDNNLSKLIYSLYNDFQLQKNNLNEDLFNIEIEDNFLEYLISNLNKKIKADYSEISSIDIDENEIISSKTFNNLNKIIEDIYNENQINKDSDYDKNIKELTKLLIFCEENILKLNVYKESYAEETFKEIEKKILNSDNLRKLEFDKYLNRFFYFMNIFFRIENCFEIKDAKFDFERISNEFLSKINKFFSEFKGEDLIKKHKEEIIEYIKKLKKNYRILMEENDNNIDQLIELINLKFNHKIDKFKEELENHLNELQNKINIEMKNIGLFETSIINRKIEYKKSLGQKILIVHII